MPTRAPISPGYRWRLGIIGLVCLGFAGYCFYDGYYNYPRKREIALEFLRFKQDFGPNNYAQEWEKYALSRGWPLDDPGKPKTDLDILTQYIMMAITLPIGLIFAVSFVRSGGRWVQMDDDGLTTSWGQSVPFGSITQLNKERWYTKGIALVKYQDSESEIERTLVLDDWKFERHATKAMVEAVESKLRPDQIVGQRETPEKTEEKPSEDNSPSRGEDAAAEKNTRTPPSA